MRQGNYKYEFSKYFHGDDDENGYSPGELFNRVTWVLSRKHSFKSSRHAIAGWLLSKP